MQKKSSAKIPKLPQLLDRKIYKTGQTRGADDDVVYQNRVGRNSTVLIPYENWEAAHKPPLNEPKFENGFIVLISPEQYFLNENIAAEMSQRGLFLGRNTLIFYETRQQWRDFNPEDRNLTVADKRVALEGGDLGGQYVARVPATTATDGGEKITRGFSSTSLKGAGIRIYEYASSETINKCRMQLELLFWLCIDSSIVATEQGMNSEQITLRKDWNLSLCEANLMLDKELLTKRRLISKSGNTICPLCLEEISSRGFFNKVEQAEGRVVPDLTVTQLNLFHIDELRIGRYGHRPYNLGWGHHHCNVVVKDAGIDPTLIWMNDVVDRNIEAGYLQVTNKGKAS